MPMRSVCVGYAKVKYDLKPDYNLVYEASTFVFNFIWKLQTMKLHNP